ncbi:tyrosine-type recombinase/integrase [Vibrio splendidus]
MEAEKEFLEAVVEQELKRVISGYTAILYPRSKSAKQLQQVYQASISSKLAHNYSQDDYGYSEPVHVPTFAEFKIERISRNLKKSVPQVHDGDIGIEDYYHQPQQDLNLINTFNSHLSEQVLANKLTEAMATLETLKQTFEIPVPSVAPVPEVVIDTTPLWEDGLQQLIDDKTSQLYQNDKGKVAEVKTVKERIKWLTGYFSHFFNGKRLSQITYRELDEAFTTLSDYPQEKFSPYNKQSIAENVQEAYDQTVEEDRKQASILVRAKMFLNKYFDYFYRKSIIEVNPVTLMRYNKTKEGKARGAYNQEQLSTLETYCLSDPLSDYTAALLIMRYAGLRNIEILRLTASSILESDGVPYLDVIGTKNDNSSRKIPIHQQLYDLGVIDYLTSNGKFKITSQQLTVWFSRLTDKLNLPTFTENDEILTFYSLRHSYATSLANVPSASDPQIDILMGHAIKGTKRHYIGALSLRSLHKIINQLR